jgi:signal transduction histidine kinase/DNA-binding LacI/PurR family transcriptional regulator
MKRHNKNGKRLTIGYFNNVLFEEWSFPSWRGAAEAALKHDVHLLSFHGRAICSTSGYEQQENIIYDIAKSDNFDGHLIWKGNISLEVSDAEFESFCTGFGVPFVTIEGSIPGCPSVTYGNYEGMRMIVDHLIETHGYSKIGMVGYVETERHAGFEARYRAYCDSMRDHSLEIRPSWMSPLRSWGPSSRSFFNDLDAWLKKVAAQDIEAIVGICDPISIRLIWRLKALGYSVPDDIAVVGYDNFDYSRALNPTLTTVDPSWEGLGALAFDTLMDIIHGNPVPERRAVEAKLVIGRSCGCIEENVRRAAQISTPGIRAIDEGGRIVNEMMDAVHCAGNVRIRRACESMLASLNDDTVRKDRNRFLIDLEKALSISMDAGNDVLEWQDALSLLQKYAGSGGAGNADPNILLHQGRVMVGNAGSNASEYRRLEDQSSINAERNLELNLITTFDLAKLLDLLAQGLPGLGIPRFYVSLYENPKSYAYPEPAPEWSRLVLAHNGEGRIGLDPDGIRYKTRDLLPDSVWPSERPLNLAVNPLYFQDTQIGLLMFGAIPRNQMVFEVFRVELSSALKGVLLVQKVEHQMRELAVSNEELARSYKELKRNQQALLASEKMASLGRLSAGIAHEMNTPLAAVRAALRELGFLVDEYGNSIGNPGVTDEDHRGIVEDMHKNISIATQAAGKSAGFIKGMKSQATPQSMVTVQSFDARELVADTLVVLEYLLKKSNCAVVKDMGDTVLVGNPRAFGQIVTNLLVNAVDACRPGGGTISVSLSQNPDHGGALLTIRDTGVGIPKENLGKIFEPFFTTKPFGEGSGLGLTIVYDLVNELGGRIDVESVPGDTVFRIAFPLRKGG